MLNKSFKILIIIAIAALPLATVLLCSDDGVKVINDDAGWCWFQDERAIFANGKLIVGSVAAGKANASRRGNIEVSSMDPATGRTERFVLRQNLELDDHDAPALLEMPDGRILAFYSKHNKDLSIRYRITTNPGDITDWQPEKTYDFKPGDHNVTYSNLFRLEKESGRIYDFFRGEDFDPGALVSGDGGATWKYAGRIVGGPGRPYVRYASDNSDTVHFVCTEQHPRDFDNSLYHGYLRGGRIYNSYGAEAGALGMKPAEHKDLTRIFKGDANNVAWPSDVELASDGRIYVVYSVQKDGAGLLPGMGGKDHRYRYAWFDGKDWHDHGIAYAGSKLYSGEDDYTGLVCLNPASPDTVYFSTNVDPVSGKKMKSRADGLNHYELFKGVTEDGGATWKFTPVTSDSNEDQIRPNVPKGGPDGSALIWLRGKMKTFTDYDFEMVVKFPAP